MDMGHLYHDAVYGDPILALDVKEQMRTREINACEEINLARKSQIYDRAKDLCEKTVRHEKWRIGQTINVILERSPHLERSLALEKARLEMLHNILTRRREATKTSRQSSSPLPRTTTVTSPVSRTTLSSKRPATRKGRSALKGLGRRRRQDREKSKKRRKKEDGPLLNTDFSFERHLPKPSLYSKRNEHAVKTLARISWKMETRKRDHRLYQENLVHFSKPMVERARMVLRGRPDMDVEQFLQEFEDFLYPKEKTNIKVTYRKAKRKRSSENETSAAPSDLSQETLVQLTKNNEENDGHIPLMNTGDINQGSSLGQSISHDLPSKLRNLTLSPPDNCDGSQVELRGDTEHTGANACSSPSKTRPSSEREGSFHLAAIVATKSDVMNLKSRPGSSAGISNSEQSRGESSVLKGSSPESPLYSRDIDLNNNKYGKGSEFPKLNANLDSDQMTRINDNSSGEKKPKETKSPSRESLLGEKLVGLSNTGQTHSTLSGEIPTDKGSKGIQREKYQPKSKDDPRAVGEERSDLTVSSNRDEHHRNSGKPITMSAGIRRTPSTVLSQVIIEEDEISERHTRDTPSTSSTLRSRSNHRQSPRSKPDGEYIQRLPLLTPHGKASNRNLSSSTSSFNSSEESPNSPRKHSPWRSKPEFSDLFSTKKKHHFESAKESDRRAAESKFTRHRETNLAGANVNRKKDLLYSSLDLDKKDNHHIVSSHTETKDIGSRRFNPRNASYSGAFRLDNPEQGFLPSLASKRSIAAGSDIIVNNGGIGPEDNKENSNTEESYTLTCTVGLPKLWKQSMDKKKDPRAEPEVSAAAIARRHRRGQTNPRSLF